MHLSAENNIFAQLVAPIVGGAANTGLFISLKNVQRALIYCIVKKAADATQVTWTLSQASGNAGSAAGTAEKAMTNVVPIYISDNAAGSNVLTAATAAKSYQCAATVSVTQVVVFDIVPELCMDLANSFDCVTVDSTDPTNVNYSHAFAILEPRYTPLPTVYSD